MFRTKLARLMAAVVCAAVLSPTHALAAPHAKALPKPPVVAHPDVAPTVPGNVTGTSLKMSASLGSVIPGATGSNSVTFGSFRDGDIIVVLDPAGLTGHAGMFDSRYYGSLYSYAMWSANVSPVNGVQREQCVKYRANDEAFALRVSGGSYYRAAARNFAARQLGKPYNILGAKTDLSSFYCSKVAWTSWRYTMGVDLDGDGGYWVWPVDLINSSHTILFGYWG
jgi:hypothetical protein